MASPEEVSFRLRRPSRPPQRTSTSRCWCPRSSWRVAALRGRPRPPPPSLACHAHAPLPFQKPKLTKEQARAQAEELRRTILAKREKEEKESERLREKERIRSGKELLAAKRVEEDQERKRNIDWRRREKEEEARARARIAEKLAEDKAERRRKLGLPELTPDELAAEAAKAAAAKAAAADEAKAARGAAGAAAAAQRAKSGGIAEKLRAELVALKRSALGRAEGGAGGGAEADAPEGEARAKAAFALLLQVVGNVATAPGEAKYRSLKLSGAAVTTKLAPFPASLRFLGLLGWGQDAAGEFLVLREEDVNMQLLQAAGGELNSALNNPFFGVL